MEYSDDIEYIISIWILNLPLKHSEFDMNLFSDSLDEAFDDNNYVSKVRAKHRTRVYISHEISHHDDHHDVQAKSPADKRIVASHDESTRVSFSEDKENVDVEVLETRDLRHSDNFKDILRGCEDTKDEDSGINSTSSSDSQECHKPKLVGILKSPGKRRYFRKHVEFLDKHEGRELDVSIRYF